MPQNTLTVTLTADQHDAVSWYIAQSASPGDTVDVCVQRCLDERLQPLVTAMLSADAGKVQSAFLLATAQKRNAVKNTLGV